MQGVVNIAVVDVEIRTDLASTYNITEPEVILSFQNDKYEPIIYEGTTTLGCSFVKQHHSFCWYCGTTEKIKYKFTDFTLQN